MTKRPPAKSELEETFALHCKVDKIGVEREYKFHPDRAWRFDFAIPTRKIAIECEGGIWSGGAHTRGKHFLSDMEKYNEAAKMGWFIFRFDIDAIKSGKAIQFLLSVLAINRAQ